MQNKTINYLTSCLIFASVVFFLCSNFEMLLADPDTAWHLAAGDLIRKTGAIPKTDPWAFTSAGVPWINLAWLWDVWMSILNEQLGWHGQIAFLSIIYALTMVLVYNACLLRSGNGIASFFSVFFVVISMPLFLRSMWMSNLFLALIFLLALLMQYRGWSVLWWYAMPALMPLWVNVHGGFIVAFALLGAFGLQALVHKKWRFALHLAAAGLLSIAALGITPYGYKGVFDVVTGTFTTPALAFIAEFQPSTFSWGFLLTNLYIPVFLFCALHRPMKTSLAEAILGYGLILLAATSMRYWTFVYLFSAPLLAQYFTGYMSTSQKRGNQTVLRIAEQLKQFFFTAHAKTTCAAISLAMAAGLVFLFSPATTRLLKLEGYDPYRGFLPVIEFVRTHYPHHRFFTDYSSSGPLILESGGTFPVFIDGRGENAYPRSLIKDYSNLLKGKKDWEEIMDDYHVDGVIYINIEDVPNLPLRLKNRKGWKKVFEDEMEVVFVRE